MNIMFYGNTGCGKSTLAETICKRYPYFKHVNTGALTRMMASFGCKNLPLLVQDMIKSMSPIENHIFDHFYTHTWEQLNDLFGAPYVVAVEDKRTNRKPVHEMKHNRFLAQAHEIHRFMIAHHIVPIKVYNTDYGFDVSELIKADILPFDEFAVLRPGSSMKNDYIQHMPFVCQEYYHAVDKYPDFVDKFVADTTILPAVENSLTAARAASDAEKKDGYSFERTLNEEVLEVLEAYLKGEYKHCYQELAQCAAVCVRGMDWIRNHHKEAFNGKHD